MFFAQGVEAGGVSGRSLWKRLTWRYDILMDRPLSAPTMSALLLGDKVRHQPGNVVKNVYGLAER